MLFKILVEILILFSNELTSSIILSIDLILGLYLLTLNDPMWLRPQFFYKLTEAEVASVFGLFWFFNSHAIGVRYWWRVVYDTSRNLRPFILSLQ